MSSNILLSFTLHIVVTVAVNMTIEMYLYLVQ